MQIVAGPGLRKAVYAMQTGSKEGRQGPRKEEVTPYQVMPSMTASSNEALPTERKSALSLHNAIPSQKPTSEPMRLSEDTSDLNHTCM